MALTQFGSSPVSYLYSQFIIAIVTRQFSGLDSKLMAALELCSCIFTTLQAAMRFQKEEKCMQNNNNPCATFKFLLPNSLCT